MVCLICILGPFDADNSSSCAHALKLPAPPAGKVFVIYKYILFYFKTPNNVSFLICNSGTLDPKSSSSSAREMSSSSAREKSSSSARDEKGARKKGQPEPSSSNKVFQPIASTSKEQYPQQSTSKDNGTHIEKKVNVTNFVNNCIAIYFR